MLPRRCRIFAAAVDFAENSRELRVMHGKEAIGKVLFVWPATSDVLKAFGFQSRMSGLAGGRQTFCCCSCSLPQRRTERLFDRRPRS